MIEIFNFMLQARDVRQYSNCSKRHIACVIPLGVKDDTLWGYNNVMQPCKTCSRETCGAIHAEQHAIAQLMYHRLQFETTKMYLWAEPPCMQCLNFINRFSAISIIYCLSPESYLTEYPLIARRTDEIRQRREYAESLGISIIELDREEILEHELSQHSNPDI